MISNYIKTALRNFYRNKSITLIKILGLSLGLSVTFFILIFISQETSYNKVHENHDSIYRVIEENYAHNWHMNSTPFPLSTELVNNYPEVKNATRILRLSGTTIKMDNEIFNANKFICVDGDFFEIFTIEKLNGDFLDFDNDFLNIAISESAAIKYFGNIDLVNKIMSINSYGNEYDLTIKAVYKDFPVTSTIRPDFIASVNMGIKQMDKMITSTDNEVKDEEYYRNQWEFGFLETYVLLRENTNPKHINTILKKIEAKNVEDITERDYYLQSFNDIYLHSSHIRGSSPQGNLSSIYIFSAIALLVLIIACINYIILSTSQIISRSKEIGVRKIIGAGGRDLLKQILTESFIIALFAIVLSFIIIEQFRPLLNQLLEKQIFITYGWKFITGFLLVTSFIILMPGFYILYYLNRISPVSILGKEKMHGASKFNFKKILIVVQFIIFIVLVVGAVGIIKQLHFAMHSDLGFSIDNRLIISVSEQAKSGKYQTIKDELLKNPQIKNISGAMWLPPSNNRMSVNLPKPNNEDEQITMEALFVDKDFIETFNLELTEGKSFKEFGSNAEWKIIINQQAKTFLDIDNIVGTKIWGGEIVGVVSDFKFHSFHEKVPPLVIIVGKRMINEMVIHYDNEFNLSLIEDIENSILDISPEIQFNYKHLKDGFETFYKEEKKQAVLISIFSLIAIFIASIGLLGLIIFTAKKQSKYIAIRKVNGASIANILKLIAGDYVKLIVIALVIAIPIAYYVLNRWLQNFAYKTNIDWWLFALAGTSAFIITMLTISWYSIKAARKNPVESLRYE